jgi:hypothetical protein
VGCQAKWEFFGRMRIEAIVYYIKKCIDKIPILSEREKREKVRKNERNCEKTENFDYAFMSVQSHSNLYIINK